MDSIIVTITNTKKAFFYDIEVPTNLVIEKLKVDIAEALNGYNPKLVLNATTIVLCCKRTAKSLGEDETMESAGVLNGDYLIIKEAQNGRYYR